ncbi:hypothetical protein KKH59_00915, partial [Patescibacteria group bacterium]|nr:hypothetical protein [Patescibacteria group bacterium]
CLIWDNARWHKSKQLREKLKKNNSLKHIHLINFPRRGRNKTQRAERGFEGGIARRKENCYYYKRG